MTVGLVEPLQKPLPFVKRMHGGTPFNTATPTKTTNKNNFDELKQSLTDEINFANKDMDDAKKGLNHH